MIDSDLKNKLLDIYRYVYGKTDDKNSYWSTLSQGELIGTVRVLSVLGLDKEMAEARVECLEKAKENNND